MWKDRTKVLIGEVGVEKLAKAKVAVIGIGGVGGWACVMLARAGVENLRLVDFDRIDETNINRQFVADTTTIGRLKTEVMQEKLLEINPSCKVEVISQRLTKDNIQEIIKQDFDYVIDAIDSVQDKVELICFCKEHNINIISAMGSGNRIDVPEFKVVDIYKTSNDGLARVMRKKLRERKVDKLDVAVSTQCAIKHDESVCESKNVVGSISYYPAMCGCVLSAYVVKKILAK